MFRRAAARAGLLLRASRQRAALSTLPPVGNTFGLPGVDGLLETYRSSFNPAEFESIAQAVRVDGVSRL